MDERQIRQFNDNLRDIHRRVHDLEINQNRRAVAEKPGAFTAGSVLFAQTPGKIGQSNTVFFWDNTNSRLGIGTATPNTRLHLHGTNASYTAGPHVEFTTGADIYPLLQVLPFTHDNVNISFDAYFDGTNWVSSDAGSNYQIRKQADVYGIWSDNGITAGNTLTWDRLFGIPVSGGFTSDIFTAVTNAAVGHSSFALNTSGTAAAGLGPAIFLNTESDNGTMRTQADVRAVWATATDASRKGRMQLVVYDTVGREFFRGESNGSAPMIGFLSTTASAKLTVTGSRGGNAALASLLTQLATYGLITDSSTA